MPELARATIGVDLDGKRIPAEAEALAREAGDLAGNGFNDEFGKGIDKGGKDRKRTLGQQFKELGSLAATAARNAGSEFTKEFDRAGKDVRRNLTGPFGALSQISQALSSQGRAIADGFRNAADRVGDFGTRLRTAATSARTLGDDIGTRITAGLTRARGAVDRFGTGVLAAFRKFDDPTLGARVGDSIVRGITRAATRVEQFGRDFGAVFRGLPSIGEAAFGNLRLRLLGALNGRTLGAQLGDGIVNGLRLAAFNIEQRFKAVPANIAAAFGNLRLRLLGAVNGRAIGAQIGDAIAGGLTLSAFKVERVATAMGVAFSRFRIAAADQISRFVTAADGFFLRLGTGVARVASSIGTSMTVAFSNLRLRSAELFTGIAHGLDTLVRAVPTLARAFGGATLAALNTFGTKVDKVTGLALVGFEKVAVDAVKMGEEVAKGVGKAATETEKAASGIGSSLGKVAGAFRGFDPFDDFGSAIVAILSLLPPLAVLSSAAAAGLVILGSALASAVVGAGSFFILFEGILRLDPAGLQKLGTSAAQAGNAFQTFFGTFEKSKFFPGQIDQIRTSLERAFLTGLTPTIERLSNILLPHLVDDFGLIGTALQKVFTAFTAGLTTPAGLVIIDSLFKDMAQQLPIIGQIVGNLGGILARLFVDANGPATDFLTTIRDMTGDFVKFLDTPQGKNAVQKWLADMQVVLQQVGTLAGQVYTAITDLVTKNNIDTTVKALKNLGDAAPKIADATNAIGKLAEGLTKVIDAVATVADAFTNLDPVIQGVAFAIVTMITEASNSLAKFAPVIQDVATIIRDEMSGDLLGAGLAAQKLGADLKAAFTNGGPAGLKLTTAQVREMTTALEQDAASAGRTGKSLSTYISLLGGVPPEVKTQILLDALKAGQDINQFSAALLVLPKSTQVKIISDAAAAGKDVSGLVSVIKQLPPTAQFKIIDNVAQSGGDLTKFVGLINKLPPSAKVQIITDAIAAGVPVSALVGLINKLPPQAKINILTTAAAAGVPVNTLKTLIQGLKDKAVKVTADTATGQTLIKGFQSEINAIKQGKVPGVTADTKDGQSLIKLLQSAIDGIKQKGKPPVDVDPLNGKGHVKELQGLVDAIKQKAKPGVDIDNAKGLTDTKNLQLAVNALKQGKLPGVDVNNTPGLTSTKNLQLAVDIVKQKSKPPIDANNVPGLGTLRFLQNAINALRQTVLPRVIVPVQTALGNVSTIQNAINSIHGTSATVSVSYVTTNSPPAGTVVAAHGAFMENGAKKFAGGGMNVRDGMLARGGSNILWAEPETGWEAYISGAAGQSARNISVLMEAARRLGVSDQIGGGGKSVNFAPGAVTVVSPSADPAQVASAVVDRLVPHF